MRLLATLLWAMILGPAVARGQAVDETARLMPQDYYESRNRFTIACRAAPGALCQSWPIESATNSGLTIDTAFISRGGSKLLVLQSGIHGWEGPAGAAVQALVFDQYLPALRQQGIDVLMIHALNPWGFVHQRRTDEWNVNLNRNFSWTGEEFVRDPNPRYAAYRGVFEPSGKVADIELARLRVAADFARATIVNGFSSQDINIAFDQGQYSFPNGINYGGRALSQQGKFLRNVVAPYLARDYARILYLDIHTGLGPRAVLTFIRGIDPDPRRLVEFGAMLKGLPGIEQRSPDSPGNFPTTGDVIDYLPHLARYPDRVLAVTMEYGTLGEEIPQQLDSVARMILENRAWFNKCVSDSVCDKVRRDFRALFTPEDPSWRAAVIKHAHAVLGALLARW